jgi:HSP20 family protein
VLSRKHHLCDDVRVRPRVHAIAFSSDLGAFADEVRQIYRELGRAFGSESLAGECAPPVDVYETDDTIEVAVDLPGVEAATVRLVSKADAILIAGEKPAHRAHGDSSFHLVERGYGRFARVVRIGPACDLSRSRASLARGELRISLPKIADRRGRAQRIDIRTRTAG